MKGILDSLREQRWDDHRYYHHSRVNQTLHLVSALAFLCAYALLYWNPAMAAMVGWLVAMVARQSGHFFFEPKGYDEVNQATHEHKEAIKVGYNLKRKAVLLAIWALSPIALWVDPSLLGIFETGSGAAGAAAASPSSLIEKVGLMWLVLGAAGLVFRAVHLFWLRDLQTGLVWALKILTDPFHDVMLYWRAPLHLMRGEWIDPSIRAHRAGG